MEIWLGEAGSGKTASVCQAVINEQDRVPGGGPIFVITPDQATFVVEKRLLNVSSEGVLTRAQVYHFRRLAFRILSERQQLPMEMISPAGKYAIFTACFQDVLPKLTALARSEQDPRYLERLLKFIEEFQESGSIQEFEIWLARAPLSPRLQTKMLDLLLLWRTYETAIADHFLDPYHLMPSFADYLYAHPEEFADWTVYIDGFLGFTGQEWQVVKALAKVAQRLIITIGMPPTWSEMPEQQLAEVVEFSPFFQAVDILNKVKKIAIEQGIQIQTLKAPKYRQGARFDANSLRMLESHLFSASSPRVALEKDGPIPGFRMATALRIEDEVKGVIRDLFRQKNRHGFRYRDFSLIVTDWEAYRPVMVRELQRALIPYSIDEKTSIAPHPYPRLILSIIGFASGQEDDAIEMIKSDLFLLTRNEADRLENFLYENGISLRAWLDEPSMSATSALSSLKERLRIALHPFLQMERNVSMSVETWLRTLWAVLDSLSINDQLAHLDEYKDSVPEELRSRKSRPIVALTVQIFDDLVMAMGGRPLTAKLLYDQLYHAFHSATTGSIPVRVNEVILTDVSRVRAFECEVVYLLGCQEGTFPRRVSPDELLGDAEREELTALGQYVAAESRVRQQFERYRVYMAMTRAKRQLILSYTMQDESGKSRLPAILLRKWQRDFNGLAVETWNLDQPQSNEEMLSNIHRPEDAAELFSQWISSVGHWDDVPVFWKAVYRLFASDIWPKTAAIPYLIGMGHTAKSDALPRDVAMLLYGEKFSGNVSRLERFAACPFAHFIDYGLKAKERRQVVWDARNQGNFLHHVLHETQVELSSQRYQWSSLSDDQVDEVTGSIFLRELSRFEGGRLNRGGHNQLLATQLSRTLIRAMRVLTEHARRSEFFPWKLEENFTYEDAEGGFLLKGRMDRIDMAKEGNQFWFRIIDFKSSMRTVDFAKMYYGLSLQLLLYAGVSEDDSATVFGRKAQFAGMFYFPVIDPIRQKKKFTASDQALETLRKDNKMSGIIIGKLRIVNMLDRRIEEGKTDLFDKMLNKDKVFQGNAPVISENAWEALKRRGYAHTRTLSTAASTGDTSIRPYKLKNETPCAFCELKSVCAFEPQFHGAMFRRLRPIKKQDVLLALVGEESR